MPDLITEVLAPFEALDKEWRETTRQLEKYGANTGPLEAARRDLAATLVSVRAEFELLSVDQYASLQGVHPATVKRWITAGELAAVETAKGWRIRRTAIRQKPRA